MPSRTSYIFRGAILTPECIRDNSESAQTLPYGFRDFYKIHTCLSSHFLNLFSFSTYHFSYRTNHHNHPCEASEPLYFPFSTLNPTSLSPNTKLPLKSCSKIVSTFYQINFILSILHQFHI